MLRIATINNLDSVDTNTPYSKLASVIKNAPLNILFGQTACLPGSDPHRQARDLAQSLEMTYMYSNASQDYAACKQSKKRVQTGFSILTAKNCWMLNSGSFSLIETNQEQRQIQFGVIRVLSNSVLVINVRFTNDNPKKQLLQLLNHPLLSHQFGAIILNGNLNLLLSEKATKKAFDSKGLIAHGSHFNNSVYSPLSILSSKETPLTSITIGNTSSFLSGSGQVTELEMTRLPKTKHRKRYHPLSFRERYLGSRDGYRAFAY